LLPRYLVSFALPVVNAIPVPKLSTVRIYLSRPIVPVKLSIPVPVLSTIRKDDSRSVFPVKMALTVPDLVSSVLKLTASIEEGVYCFPDI
jgi:hypothetical protein